ncbi:MAG: hypothetical protein H7Y11_05135, partial [Armatimonadetes bacterium]|nr:hypothetical protein [Anaerolineae bacterium]
MVYRFVRAITLVFALLIPFSTFAQPATPPPPLTETAQLGRGTAITVAWNASSNALAVGGSLGVTVYAENFPNNLYLSATLSTNDAVAGVQWVADANLLAVLVKGKTADNQDTSAWQFWEWEEINQALTLVLTAFDAISTFKVSADHRYLAILNRDVLQILALDSYTPIVTLPNQPQGWFGWNPNSTQ